MSDKKKFWKEEEIKKWSGVEELKKRFYPSEEDLGKTDWQDSKKPKKKWVFRAEKVGQGLKTNLEEKFRLNGIRGKNDKIKKEKKIIREFQRKAALYLECKPDNMDDILEWLAIMRHRGAPTRLLDWTYSFYIALYFALAENKKGIVWALDIETIFWPEPIIKRICEVEGGFGNFGRGLLYYMKKCDFLGIQADKFIDLAIIYYLMKYPIQCVYAVNPFSLNRRLSVQKGVFLMPGDITKSFKKNLVEAFGGCDETKKFLRKIKITPNEKDRKEILKEIGDMNISNEALFPGSDGFAKSVGEGLADTRKLGAT